MMEKIYTTKNIDRIRVIQAYIGGQYTRKMAAMNLGVTERQVTRIVNKYIEEGPESVIHGNTGKTAINKCPDSLRQEIISLYKGKYGKNGVKLNFCHFMEKLEEENLLVPYSTLRRILIEGGIKPPETRAAKIISPPRPRRVFAGELLQVDASIHRWLYGDNRLCALHGAIDYATDTLTGLWLEEAENMHGYQMVLYQTIKNYGIPKCFYTDNRTVFENPGKNRISSINLKSKLNSPRFRVLLTSLGIDIITTSNPRAKGRIERVWRTLQSRLLNELHLRKITTIKEANVFIQEYLPILNKAFASDIETDKNSFRKVPTDYNYNQNLALFKEVKIHNGCYVIISNHYHIIKNHGSSLPGKVRLYKFLNGSYHIMAEGSWYEIEDIGPRSAHKNLLSEERTVFAKRNTSSPWRQYNPNFINRDRTKWDDENLGKMFLPK